LSRDDRWTEIRKIDVEALDNFLKTIANRKSRDMLQQWAIFYVVFYFSLSDNWAFSTKETSATPYFLSRMANSPP
jgi:hypothetical protein